MDRHDIRYRILRHLEDGHHYVSLTPMNEFLLGLGVDGFAIETAVIELTKREYISTNQGIHGPTLMNQLKKKGLDGQWPEHIQYEARIRTNGREALADREKARLSKWQRQMFWPITVVALIAGIFAAIDRWPTDDSTHTPVAPTQGVAPQQQAAGHTTADSVHAIGTRVHPAQTTTHGDTTHKRVDSVRVAKPAKKK